MQSTQCNEIAFAIAVNQWSIITVIKLIQFNELNLINLLLASTLRAVSLLQFTAAVN